MNNLVVYATGVVTGMFIAQQYNIPDIKRLSSKLFVTGMTKLKEWEKKDTSIGKPTNKK